METITRSFEKFIQAYNQYKEDIHRYFFTHKGCYTASTIHEDENHVIFTYSMSAYEKNLMEQNNEEMVNLINYFVNIVESMLRFDINLWDIPKVSGIFCNFNGEFFTIEILR